MTTHVITGGTGNVGGALILELLKTDPTSHVVGLVRANDDHSATHRLRASLLKACAEYGCSEVTKAAVQRVRAVAADITATACGVVPERVARGKVVVWHAAGSAQFQEKRRDVINLHNVEGTVNVTDLASRLGAAGVNYISTAQTCGTSTGTITEHYTGHYGSACTVWESSKIAAEQHIWRWSKTQQVPVKVFRLGLVVGHSVTKGGCNRHGMFAVTRALLATRILCAMSGVTVGSADVTMVAHPQAVINMVPVDVVAHRVVACGSGGPTGQIYHITNDQPMPGTEAVAAAAQAAGLPAAVAVNAAAELTEIGRFLAMHLATLRSYLHAPKQFDTTNTRAVVGDQGPQATVSTADLIACLGRFAQSEKGPMQARLGAPTANGSSMVA